MTTGEINLKAQELAFLFFAALPDKERERRMGVGKDDHAYLSEMDDIAARMRDFIRITLAQK